MADGEQHGRCRQISTRSRHTFDASVRDIEALQRDNRNGTLPPVPQFCGESCDKSSGAGCFPDGGDSRTQSRAGRRSRSSFGSTQSTSGPAHATGQLSIAEAAGAPLPEKVVVFAIERPTPIEIANGSGALALSRRDPVRESAEHIRESPDSNPPTDRPVRNRQQIRGARAAARCPIRARRNDAGQRLERHPPALQVRTSNIALAYACGSSWRRRRQPNTRIANREANGRPNSSARFSTASGRRI